MLALITRAEGNAFALAALAQAGPASLDRLLAASPVSAEVVARVAALLKLTAEKLCDPAFPGINWDLVLANVQFLTHRYGLAHMPARTSIRRYLENGELPQRNRAQGAGGFCSGRFCPVFRGPAGRKTRADQTPASTLRGYSARASRRARTPTGQS